MGSRRQAAQARKRDRYGRFVSADAQAETLTDTTRWRVPRDRYARPIEPLSTAKTLAELTVRSAIPGYRPEDECKTKAPKPTRDDNSD